MGSTHGDDHSAADAVLRAALAPAASHPATRSALRRSTVLLVLFAVGVVLLAVTGVGLWWRQHSLLDLASSGVRATATVESVDARVVAREHHTIGSIDVSYPVEGQTAPRHQTFDVSIDVTRYHVGDKVPVAYDAAHHERVDLVGEPAASQGFVPWEVPAAFAVLAAAMAFVAIRHLRGYRRLLRRHEWLAVPATLRPAPRRLRGRGTTVVELGEPSSPERVVASPVGLRALPPTIEPVAWVAGWGEKRFVVAPAGGAPLLLVQRLSELGVDAAPERPGPPAGGRHPAEPPTRPRRSP